MIGKYGHQDFSMKFLFQRLPIDVKEAGVEGRLAILQHVEPPRVIAAHDAHVIGNYIEDQSHAMFMKGRDKSIEVLGAADLRVERIVVDNVVAMHASGTGLETRGDIAVTDAERGKIRDNFDCLLESEIPIELQPVCRERDV